MPVEHHVDANSVESAQTGSPGNFHGCPVSQQEPSRNGLPANANDDDGRLVGNLDPRHIMEELGRVEGLIDGFEREVFL